ncbi:MAG: bifunctional diaminohydroxyphosphoribosylaminopyrimidine deaminase/5-amino-6-(5-phosphoribosylamino)uracil reductase RibD [Gemmatimonadaceae bacterium]|nr:bifunctional diaminohydroxyphosphoribosylaminopyrimidine deaminase/5-amino-6-(5-phosphoribosylamino)uracil reductase RibD [Chitinophagaceae bacterium]
MQRCIELATRGAGSVAPNPMVGAVLVYQDRIIGEGFHQQYGGPHAEVNCIASVMEADLSLVGKSTMYVSLEPCSHFGNTPPCADLIIRHKIPAVVIGTIDPFAKVNGSGITRLKAAGIDITLGVLTEECERMNRRFFVFQQLKRPYIILKWAQTNNARIGGNDGERMMISNEMTNRLVHKWRSEESAIMVGTNTAQLDDPSLTTRLWTGASPVRVVADMHLRLPATLKLMNRSVRTIVFNHLKDGSEQNLQYIKIDRTLESLPQMLSHLYDLGIQSMIIEGGGKLIGSFISENFWDEVRVITNTTMTADKGIPAPELTNEQFLNECWLREDRIAFYTNKSTQGISDQNTL